MVPPVNSAGLRPDQIERLAVCIKRMRHYLDTLATRMHQRHFPHDDPLRASAEHAFDAVSALMVEVERLQRQED